MAAVELLVAGALVSAAAVVGAWWGSRRGGLAARRASRERVRRWRSRARAFEAEAGRLRALQDAVFASRGIALIEVDPVGSVRSANSAAQLWFGIDPVGASSLVSAVPSPRMREALTAAQSGEATPDGLRIEVHRRVYHADVAPLPDGGALVALRDDTEVERLARAQRELIAGVSHDLRTPLSSVILLAESLAGSHGDDPELRKRLADRLLDQARALVRIAEALVDLDRLDSGRAPLRFRPQPVAGLVAEAVRSLAPQLDAAGVTVETAVADDLDVLADGRHAVRALANLLDNAVQHSSAGGVIRVGAVRQGDEVVVSVADEGPGIPPTEAESVFERFYRIDRSRSGGGQGLGLAIVRYVAEGHGGRAWVDTTVTRGARVCLSLPSADASDVQVV